MSDTPRFADHIREVFSAFLLLGLTSFGGPIAHLGYFRTEFVERRRWLSEQAYADLVALCQFLPGPASSQVGFALGLMRAGPWGAVAAWTAFTLPSAILLVLFTVIVATVGLTRNQLLYVTFDETAAAVSGLSVTWYNRVMVMLTALVVVGAMQIMGVILVAAMLVVPVAAATAVGGFKRSVAAAVLAGQAATLTGTTLSYSYDVAAGGAIALVAIAIFAAVRLALAVRPG